MTTLEEELDAMTKAIEEQKPLGFFPEPDVEYADAKNETESKVETVLEQPSKPKRGRGRPPGAKNKPKVPEAEVESNWFDTVALVLLEKGHSQKNVLFRAYHAMGLTRVEGNQLYSESEGTFRERINSMFAAQAKKSLTSI